MRHVAREASIIQRWACAVAVWGITMATPCQQRKNNSDNREAEEVYLLLCRPSVSSPNGFKLGSYEFRDPWDPCEYVLCGLWEQIRECRLKQCTYGYCDIAIFGYC